MTATTKPEPAKVDYSIPPSVRLTKARETYERTCRDVARLEGDQKIAEFAAKSSSRDLAAARELAAEQSADIDAILSEIEQREAGVWVEPAAPTAQAADATRSEKAAESATNAAPMAQAANPDPPATGAERLALEAANADAANQAEAAKQAEMRKPGFWV